MSREGREERLPALGLASADLQLLRRELLLLLLPVALLGGLVLRAGGRVDAAKRDACGLGPLVERARL
eukprot:8870560-Heterocapsa_arctica.AAC.1